MCIESAVQIMNNTSVILLDIEGTTTAISFVKEKLFPYAEIHLENYIKKYWNDNKIKEIIHILINDQEAVKDYKGFISLPSLPSDESKMTEFIDKIISHLQWQQSNDFKSTGLKRLQGYIWKDGYLNKSIEGHLYDDVSIALKQWKKTGKQIYIYSSGSIEAQKLLFCNSKMGDLSDFIDGNFDTTIGSKIEAESYLKIAKSLQEKPENIVFFTDRPKEVAAAKKSGMNVVRMIRDDPNPYLEEEKEFIGQEDATLTSFSPLLDN